MDVGNLFFTSDLVHIVGTNIGDWGQSDNTDDDESDNWIGVFVSVEYY